MKENFDFKFLLLGEAVVDLISTGIVTTLEDASGFQKFAGGEVSNLAMNLSRLGFPAALGACVGEDSFGIFLRKELTEAGVNLAYLQSTSEAPTTIIPVTRQIETPDFAVYRGADRCLSLTDSLISAVADSSAIHTSAFALSQDPCRSTIYHLLKAAHKAGLLISLDPNYHPGIWPEPPDYLPFLKEIFQLITVTKPSLDDCIRIFGPDLKPVEYLELFLNLGPAVVVLTMGSQGALLGTSTGDRVQIHASSIPVKDVTGAGDAFWSGLLTGLLQGITAIEAAQLGQAVAEYKIGTIGPVKEFLPLEDFKKQAKLIQISYIS